MILGDCFRTTLVLAIVIGLSSKVFAQGPASTKAASKDPASPVVALTTHMLNRPFLSEGSVSSAQDYQATSHYVMGEFAYIPSNSKSTLNSNTTNVDTTLTGFAVRSVFLIQGMPDLRVSLSMVYAMLSGKAANPGTGLDTKIESNLHMNIASITYDFNKMFAASLEAENNTDASKTTTANGTESKTVVAFNKIIPSVAYHQPLFEIGVRYYPTINLNGESSAGKTTIYGEGKINPKFLLGSKMDYVRNEELDSDQYKNTQDITIFGELRPDSAKMFGTFFRYEMDSAKEKKYTRSSTIPEYAFGVYADFLLKEKTNIGVHFSYATGSGKGESVGTAGEPKYDKTRTTIRVNGLYLL